MAYIPVDEGILEQKPEVFYGRLRTEEVDPVRNIVEGLGEHMKSTAQGHFLVAGVGGILRRKNPWEAIDIDLAVVGYKFAPLERHNFRHVTEFTSRASDYFEGLCNQLSLDGLESDQVVFSRGSGPLALLELNRQRIFRKGKDEVLTAKSEIERFGQYDSKGIQITHKGMRPIDVQFVFNKNTEEWSTDQAIFGLRSMSGSKEPFFYSVLARGP